MYGEIIADLMPTEDPIKLSKTIKKIFPDAELEIRKNRITGNTNLKNFFELVRKQKIRTTIHEVIEKNKKGKESFLDLNKMACEVGKISLDEGFPLGKIRLVLKDLKEE